jgi:hypothetical protein
VLEGILVLIKLQEKQLLQRKGPEAEADLAAVRKSEDIIKRAMKKGPKPQQVDLGVIAPFPDITRRF